MICTCQGFLRKKILLYRPTFIDFLAQWLSAPHFGIQVWPDQRSEELHDHLSPMAAAAAFRLQRLLLVDEAQAAIRRVLYWVRVLAVGTNRSIGGIASAIYFFGSCRDPAYGRLLSDERNLPRVGT